MSSDYQLEDTVYLPFTTRAFATGIPTVLAGTPAIDIYEDVTGTPIITGETLAVSLNSVAGFNMITVTATDATGFEAGKSYTAIIEQGTVDGVSVAGEVVAHFTLDMSAAAKDLANATDGLGALKTLIDALNDLATSDLDAALVAIGLDHLIAAADGDDPVNGSIFAHLASATEDWSTFIPSTDSLQAIRDRGDAAWTTGAGGSPFTLAAGTIGATGNDATHLHLDGLTQGDDELNDFLIVITDVSTGEIHSRWIDDWTIGTELAVVVTLPFTPEASVDTYTVLGIRKDVNVGEIEGSDPSDTIRDAVVDDATRIDASVLNTAAAAVGSDGTGLTEAGGTGDQFTAIAVASIAAGAITAASIDADAITEAKIADDAIDVEHFTSALIAEIVDKVYDELTSAHTTVGTYGNEERVRANMALIESQRQGHTIQGSIFYVDPTNGASHASGARGGPGDPYASVQDAHDNAVTDSAHDLIVLVAGAAAGVTTLSEDVTLSKRYLQVRGPGRDFLWTRTGAGNTIAVTADGVGLSGFQLETAATGTGKGVQATDADFVLIEDLWVNATRGDGINVLRGDNNIVRRNHLEATGSSGAGDGIAIDGTGGTGNATHIEDNVFHNVQGDAIKIGDGGTVNGTIIRRNQIEGSTGWGINVGTAGEDTTIAVNVLANNASGPIQDNGATTVKSNNYDTWDELIANHSAAGSTGKALADALADTNELQGDWTDAGRLDLILDAIKVVTDEWSDGQRLDLILDLIAADVVNLDGAAMRGTDSAALASVLGALADAAAAGDPTSADTLVQYVKQLINILAGSAGIATYPAEAAPADGVSLAEAIRAIAADVTGLAGAVMRGTDSGALATSLTTHDGAIKALLPSALVGGRIDASVGAMAANVMTAAALAADAGTEIAVAVWANATRTLSAIGTGVIDATARNEIADSLLTRDWTAVTGEAARSTLNALRAIRNRVAEVTGTITVYEEDDSTPAWTAAVTRDAAAENITESDPT